MADRRYTINAFTANLTRHPGVSDSAAAYSYGRGFVGRLLELLSVEDVKATFFADDQVGRLTPSLLRTITSAGHEIGVLFESDSIASNNPVLLKNRIEDIVGRSVNGCRVIPYQSGGSLPYDLYRDLIDAGFSYSSSVFPPRDFRIGIQNTKRRAWLFRGDGRAVWELPITSWRPLGTGLCSIRSADPSENATWLIARNIDGMNRHGEPALLTLNAAVGSAGLPTGAENITFERLREIFRAYRFGTVADAFASRLTLRFEEHPARHRRTGIVRCDARSALPFL